MRKIVILSTFFWCAFILAQTPATVVSNPTSTQINATLSGPGLTVNGGVINFGKATQIATFTNGLSANLKMAKGVYFSTGSAINDLTKKTLMVLLLLNPQVA